MAKKAQKIVLFLSIPRDAAQERLYSCPKGGDVTGRQTNEAPVKYLLRENQHISEILCILTPEARQHAWQPFQTMVAQENAKVVCTPIPFEKESDFQSEVLPEILHHTTDTEKIFLETTGGLRDAIMYLLLISRALSYTGVKTAGAVYSNFGSAEKGKGEVVDISQLIELFDLIGGMQELTSFGNIKSLRGYYVKREHAPEIDSLLDAVERLWECITLCRPNQISECMSQFNQALEQVEKCSDPLIRALLPAFRNKFGERLTIPGLIKWCIQSDMLQQALTVYKERIPYYILTERQDILKVKPNAPEPKLIKDYIGEEEARFNEQFLKMSYKRYHTAKADDNNGDQKNYVIETLKHFEDLMPESYFTTQYPMDRLRKIAMDYVYIRTLRNMTNHANDQETGSQQQLMEYLNQQDPAYKRLDEVSAADIRTVINNALSTLKSLSKKERAR